MLLASSAKRSGMLLNILQYTGQNTPPPVKNPKEVSGKKKNVNHAEVKKPRFRNPSWEPEMELLALAPLLFALTLDSSLTL